MKGENMTYEYQKKACRNVFRECGILQEDIDRRLKEITKSYFSFARNMRNLTKHP